MILSEGRRIHMGEEDGEQRHAGQTPNWTEKARADSPKSVRTWGTLYARELTQPSFQPRRVLFRRLMAQAPGPPCGST